MMPLVRNLVRAVLIVLVGLVAARILVSWADPSGQGAVAGAIITATDWFLDPVRTVIPPIGSVDPVPLIVLAVLLILVRLAWTWGRPVRRLHGRIRVVGVGGGGCNAVDHMMQAGLHGVDFVAINTDAQALLQSSAPTRVRIGGRVTKGIGTGGDVALGQRAAESDAEVIREALRDSDMVFITAGLGGGTGTGAVPVIAAVAKGLGALTIGIVTLPFTFEGTARRQVAERGLEELKTRVDTLIVIPNDRVRDIVGRDVSMVEAFKLVDDVLRQAVAGITDVITVPGLINLDLADIRTVVQDAGTAIMGVGRASGENRAVEAARQAIGGELVGLTIAGARDILFNVTGSSKLGLHEMAEAAEEVRKAADPEANIIFGACVNEKMGEEVQVTVIATGFDPGRAEPLPVRPLFAAAAMAASETASETTPEAEAAAEAVAPEAPVDAGQGAAPEPPASEPPASEPPAPEPPAGPDQVPAPPVAAKGSIRRVRGLSPRSGSADPTLDEQSIMPLADDPGG
jgi:cell division protein FtsZ